MFLHLVEVEEVVDVLIHDFSCYLCLSLCAIFCGLIKPTKTTKISNQRTKMNS